MIKKNTKQKLKSFLTRLIKKTKICTLYILLKAYRDYKRLNQLIPKKEKPVKFETIVFTATFFLNSTKTQNKFLLESPHNFFQNSLFCDLKYAEITDEGSTSQEDLAVLCKTLLNTYSSIQELSLITNCIQEHFVIEQRINEIRKVCAEHNIFFSAMVSLDGVRSMHDTAKSWKNNFQPIVSVVKYCIKEKINIAFVCSISKVNIWEIDELLAFAKENNYYGRFRISEFIKCLHNDGCQDIIHRFSEEEKYHLILFFYKLIFTYEKNEIHQLVYYNIINMLNGGERIIGCSYHSNGIMLNYNGEIAYCAPESKIIDNAVRDGVVKNYQKNTEEKERILETCCVNCIDDYHAKITSKEKQLHLKRAFWKKYIRLNSTIPFGFHKRVPAKSNGSKRIFITGWYGTETVGDKAILGGIIYELKEKYEKDIEIIITSLYPIITARTIKELNIKAKIIDAYSEEFVAYAKASEIVIMGGGPLMDLEELALPLCAFKLAKSANNKTVIYGSGLGPLTKSKYIDTAKEILKLANEIKLRDEKSVKIARDWAGEKKEIICTGDPAKKYLKVLKFDNPNKENILRCFLRDWTSEYAKNMSKDEFLEQKTRFEISLSNFIKQKASELKVEMIILESMHNFVIGNDDRDFAHYFIKKYFMNSLIPIIYNKKLSTVDSIVLSMKQSVHNIVMRFHSVLFADTLETEYTAIDYTLGGKIENYLIDNNKLTNMIRINDLIDNYYY